MKKKQITRERLGPRMLVAINSGEFDIELVPASSPANPLATSLYELVLLIEQEQIARVGVWKTSEGGFPGDGAPRVCSNGSTVHVEAGEGMNGSFDIDCDFTSEAEEIATILSDRFSAEYEALEVEIAST